MAKAQEQLEACLRGELAYSQLSKALKSAIRIHIYFLASAILGLPPTERAKSGSELPEDIRNLVRDECKRLLKHRKTKL